MFGKIEIEFSEDVIVESKAALASGIEVQVITPEFENKGVNISTLAVGSCKDNICVFEITFEDPTRVSSFEIDKLRFRFIDSFVVEAA